eukprot:gene16910-22399_t
MVTFHTNNISIGYFYYYWHCIIQVWKEFNIC